MNQKYFFIQENQYKAYLLTNILLSIIMKTIVKQLEDTLMRESLKSNNDLKSQDYNKMLEQLEILGLSKKSKYTLPLVDTIGRGYYASKKI